MERSSAADAVVAGQTYDEGEPERTQQPGQSPGAVDDGTATLVGWGVS